ncbi:MAG: UDP-N-acetylmuramate dehydrogenase [Hydrogenophilaceae bacterium]
MSLRGRLEQDVDMSRHVSWRAGGRAERVYYPVDLDDLCAFLREQPESEPLHFVGLGSNLLVRDGGIKGTTVLLHNALSRIRIEDQSQPESALALVYAEAGVASPKVARFAATHDLVGTEFLAGIPGTLGGALAMNAGCYGQETWDYVTQVLTVNRHGATRRRSPREFRVGYRHVAPDEARDEWFVAAWFLLQRGDGQAGRARIKDLLKRRIASQPLHLPNAGSVFRNPPGDHAARLIEFCGLKGQRIGGAQVSEKHANFIVNAGGATAADIEGLIDLVAATVQAKTGVALIREVRIVGDK